MKGFLKKDLALLYNTGKVYLAVIAMGIVLGLVNKEMRSFSFQFYYDHAGACRSFYTFL